MSSAPTSTTEPIITLPTGRLLVTVCVCAAAVAGAWAVIVAATDRAGESVEVDEAMVRDRVSELAKDADLSKFIL